MDLIRDVLDLPILDPDGVPLGRVDGIVAELDPDGRLRVRALEISGEARARRLHPVIGRWAERLLRRVRPVTACTVPRRLAQYATRAATPTASERRWRSHSTRVL